MEGWRDEERGEESLDKGRRHCIAIVEHHTKVVVLSSVLAAVSTW